MTKPEAHVLAEVMKSTRALTKYFINQLDHATVERNHSVEGQALNSAYWVVAHIIWAEYTMLLLTLKGPHLDLPWLSHYGIGSDGSLSTERPSFPELLGTLDQVHQLAQDHIRSFTGEQLDGNVKMEAIGWDTTVRRTIHHAIRHEGQHIGHLSWICKLDGKKVI